MLSRAIIMGANSSDPKAVLPKEVKLFEEALVFRAQETATLTNDMTTMFCFSGSLRSVIEQAALLKLTFYDKTFLQRAKFPLMTALIYSC